MRRGGGVICRIVKAFLSQIIADTSQGPGFSGILTCRVVVTDLSGDGLLGPIFKDQAIHFSWAA